MNYGGMCYIVNLFMNFCCINCLATTIWVHGAIVFELSCSVACDSKRVADKHGG